MAKEWILNMATNRWGLNKKKSVGPVSQWIRECSPISLEEWKQFYFKKLSEIIKNRHIELSPQEYLQELGRKLYVKITEVISAEIDQVEENDCIEYIYNLVLNRTYEGYITEIKTVYEQLQVILRNDFPDIKIEPAPDEWDRLYNVDFYIKIQDKYLGIQIKPITYNQTPEPYRWREWLRDTHKKFEKKFGGKVFIVFSVKENNRKKIVNTEVIDEIKQEINKLMR